MSSLFGTDGVRGLANIDITCELAMDIARAAGIIVTEEIDRVPTFIIGVDSRISGKMIEAAMSAGLCSIGANVVHLGVVPTPAICYLVSNKFADAGIMISASHNSYDFNGIKIFGSDGNKLTDEQEFLIEKLMNVEPKPYPKCWKDDIGTITENSTMVNHYIDHITDTVSDVDLSGLKVAIDASNGSASATAKNLFKKLGAQATIINSSPNGININDNCGSTHIDVVANMVKNGDYDAGFAYDGDADRCLCVDENGEVISGDIMLAILSMHLKQKGKLKNDTLVATIMSNMGIFEFGRNNEVNIITTKVGDRYVLEEMLENDYSLGGEQSGHVIMKDYLSTGDGQLTSLHILASIKESGAKLSELADIMTVYPQVLKGIKANKEMKSNLEVDEAAKNIIKEAEKELKDDGRIIVRASGTEPLIRVMIECKDTEKMNRLVEQVSNDLYERLKYN